MPISVELWRAAVERWVARIKRTLIIRRGVKRAPSNEEGAPSPSGQSHTGEKKCMVKKKGRTKRKNDSYGDPGITTDDFYDGIIALAATLKYFGTNASKDCRDKNPVAPLKELLGCTGLGPLLVVVMILLLRSCDVEPNLEPLKRVDASFTLEQCFAALCFCVFLLALSIQQTLACSVGLIKAPLCVHSREVALSPTGKPDDGKVQCLVNTTGRMKHKDGLSCDTMVTRDRFNVALASVLKGMIRDAKFTDGSGRNIVCTQVELKGLSQLLGIVCLLLRSGSGEANTGPVEGGPISHQEDGMVFDESLHVEVNNDYHCAKWMKSDPEASDNLRCQVSNDVPHLSSGKLGNLVLSAKNAMAIGMTALIAIFLWCMVLVDRVCIVGLLAFLLEVTLANVKRRKAGFKPGTAVTLHSPSQQACIFKSGLVIHLFAIFVSVFKRYEHQTMSQQVSCLLVFNLASLLRDVKCTEKFLSVTFCFALLRHATCIGKWLSQAVFKPYVFLRGLLLLAGDVETNPGPTQAEVVLLDYRDRFIAEVDASTVVVDLLYRGIIDEVDQKVIVMEHNPNKRNQLLHECLMKKCTNDALRTICDVMIAVPSNPRMAALGNDMRRRVEMGSGEELPSSRDDILMLQFFKNVEAYNIEMQIVQDNFCRHGTMGFVKLAMAPFEFDFDMNLQKRFVEAVCNPEGVDRVLTLVKRKVKYKDLPAMVKQFKLLVLSGAPGVGKSTLARKLCQDISKDLKQHGYHLVLLLELHNLISYEDSPNEFKTTHLLEHFCGLMCEGCMPDTMARLVERERGKGVLLILDGYDELSAQLRQCPYFHHLLTHSLQSTLYNCDIVLTSRSIVTSEIYHHISKATPVQHFVDVEVLGFGKTEIKKFARQYFQERDRPDLLDSFLDRLEQFPQMKSLYSNPVVLSIICVVYLSQGDLPSTLTKVCDAVICEKLLLNAQDSQADSVLHLPDDHDFYQLCRIAYSCAVEQKGIFTLKELKGLSTKYSDRECSYGLLTGRPVGAPSNRALVVDSFYYIHWTVQEYLGGIDISRQTLEVQKAIWAKYLGQPHMAQVWTFFCGISHLENFDAQYLTSKLQDKEILVQSLYESQNDDLTSTAMQYAFTDSPEVKPRSPYSAVAYGYCLKQHRSMKKLTVVCRKDIHVRLGNLLSPVLQTASALDLTLSKCHPKDLKEAANSLATVEEGKHNAAARHPIGEVHFEDFHVLPLDLVVLDLIHCKRTNVEHVVSDPTQGEDVSNSLVLQSLEEAVRQNRSLSRLKIVGRQCKWTNVATAILKGAAKSTSLTELELVSPVDFPPSKDVVDDVRRANPGLKLLLDPRHFDEEDNVDDAREDHVSSPETAGHDEGVNPVDAREGEISSAGFTENICSELYQKAIIDGPTITLHVAKAMTIGPPRVGKTCFRHHLLGLQPPECNQSTPVMKTAETISLSFVQSSKDDRRWIPLSPVSGIMSLLEYLREDTNEAALHEQAEAPTFPTVVPSHRDFKLKGIITAVPDHPVGNISPMPKSEADFIAPTASLVDKQPQVEHTSDDIQLLSHEMHKLLKSVKDQDKITLPDAHLLQFIDCGGQLAYHDIIPIFVNVPAIYLHVFNLTVELTECPEDCICNEDGSDGFSAKSPLTIAQMMDRSLLVIEDLACKKVQLPKEVAAEGTPQPSVAFVGTHYDTFCAEYGDQTEAKLNEISRELNKSVRIRHVKVMHHRCPKLPPMLFPVNNYAEKTTGDDDRNSLSTSWLKKAIEKEVFGVNVKVPVKWYLYQLMQWGMKEKKEQRYGELCKSCASVGLTDKGDIYAMVTYFHSLGLLLHHCRDESTKHIEDAEGCECLVFTDPSYLFENITKLYQVQFWRDEDVHGCLRDLKKYGKLTKDALTEINIGINHKCFMDILVHLFIGADIESSDSFRSLFIPSVLTNSVDIRGLLETGTTPHGHSVHFAIAFIHGNDTSDNTTFVPCGVFTGMIARLQSTNDWEYSHDSISRLHVGFLVSTYTVKLYDHATHIGIMLKSEEEAVEVVVKDFVKYCDTIIEATANSYCFLFHSNVTEHSLSKACDDCTARPYLILGCTCSKCTAPEDLHFLKLRKKSETLFVRCQKNETSYLAGTECIPFHQRNFHCAVVKTQCTIDPAPAEKKSGKNPPSVPGVSGDPRGQVCTVPPTTTGPHFVEHPSGDMRYDGSSGPMSPWNCDALVSLREKLKLNVSMKTGLSDRLEKAAGGFMSEHEAKMVREPTMASNMEKIEKIIEILQGKTNEDFATFCTMLRETNNVVWADELEKEAERFKRERKVSAEESKRSDTTYTKRSATTKANRLAATKARGSRQPASCEGTSQYTVSAKESKRSATTYAKRSATTKSNRSAATKAKRLTTARGSRQPASCEGTSQYTGTTTGLLPISLCLTRLSMTQLASSGIHLYPPCDILCCSRNTAPAMSAMVASTPPTQPCVVTSDLPSPSAEDHSVEAIAPTHQTSVQHTPPLHQCSLRPRSKRATQNLPSEISHSKRAKGDKRGGGGQT